MNNTLKTWDEVKKYINITMGCLLIAAAVTFFMVPGNLVLGSVSGLSLVLIHFIPISISAMNLILNMAFLLLGFLFVGKEFGVKSFYTAILTPAFIYILQTCFPNMTSLTDDAWLDMLCCIFIVGIAQALMFTADASSGGLDVPAKILNKYLHIDLGKGCAFFGFLTVLSSLLIYNPKTLIIGLIGSYLNGLVVDEFTNGFTRKKRICIISDHYREIEDFILTDINRGLTLYQITGGYEKKERIEIVTILAQKEYSQLMTYLKKIDRNAFVTVTAVGEVRGIWNIRGEAKRL